jgi:AcrR family transcriptional regulator
MSGPPTKAERAEATRAALLAAARELFTEHGYAAVGTEEVVRRAKVTRGALYHHFTDKRDLFRAVFEQIESEIMAAIEDRMAGVEEPLELLRTGLRAYLDLCTDPSLTRITLVDAPSVLGWAQWREADARHALGLVSGGLQMGMDAGVLRPGPVQPLAHMLLAAIGEAGMLMATGEEDRETVESALLEIVEGLRTTE